MPLYKWRGTLIQTFFNLEEGYQSPPLPLQTAKIIIVIGLFKKENAIMMNSDCVVNIQDFELVRPTFYYLIILLNFFFTYFRYLFEFIYQHI